MEKESTELDVGNFDNEVLAYLSNRKNDLIESHEEYVLSHPEIREVLNDFLSSVLLHKPVGFPFFIYQIPLTVLLFSG